MNRTAVFGKEQNILNKFKVFYSLNRNSTAQNFLIKTKKGGSCIVQYLINWMEVLKLRVK